MKTPVVLAYVNNTCEDVTMFHGAIMAAIANGGEFGEDLSDIFVLRRPAGVWLLYFA